MNANTVYTLMAALVLIGGLAANDAFAAEHDDEAMHEDEMAHGDEMMHDDEAMHEDGEMMEKDESMTGDAMDGEMMEKDESMTGDAMDGEMMEKDDAMMTDSSAMMTKEDKAMTDAERAEAVKMKAAETGAIMVLQTDSGSYGIGETVYVDGYVVSTLQGAAIAVTVTGPNGLADIAQLTPADGLFATSFDTSNWRNLGAYEVGARYGGNSETVQIQLTEAVARDDMEAMDSMMTDDAMEETGCGSLEVAAGDQCVQVPHTIEGGSVTGISANIGSETYSLVFDISSAGEGMLEINPPASVMDGAYLVFVNNEESDDAMIDGNTVTVPITAETEQVEVFAAFVVPEFGAIAAMILAVAIVSIIAVSARSRLSIMPKY